MPTVREGPSQNLQGRQGQRDGEGSYCRRLDDKRGVGPIPASASEVVSWDVTEGTNRECRGNGNPARLLPLGYLLKVTHWTRTSDARVTTLPQQLGNTKLCKACHFPSMSWFAPEPEFHQSERDERSKKDFANKARESPCAWTRLTDERPDVCRPWSLY